jgi:hypothetical protein
MPSRALTFAPADRFEAGIQMVAKTDTLWLRATILLACSCVVV